MKYLVHSLVLFATILSIVDHTALARHPASSEPRAVAMSRVTCNAVDQCIGHQGAAEQCRSAGVFSAPPSGPKGVYAFADSTRPVRRARSTNLRDRDGVPAAMNTHRVGAN